MSVRDPKSRRTFLRLSAIGAVGALAAACGATPTATPVPPTATKPPAAAPTAAPAAPTATKAAAAPTAAPAAPTAAPAAPTAVPKAKVTGTLQFVQKNDFFPAMNDWLKAEITKYCKEQGFALEVSPEAGYTGGTPFLEKMTAVSAAGTPPDLIMHTDEIANMARLKITAPIDDVVDAMVAKWGKTAARQRNDMIYPEDKKWYYVPYFARVDGGWYQEPVFKAKNIDMTKIRLFTELWDACLTVSDPAKQMYGWGITINRSGDGDWFRDRVFMGWGAYVQDATGQYATIDTPQMVEALTQLTKIYMDAKYAPMLPPGVLSWGDSSNNEAWLAAKLAFTFNGGTIYGKSILDKNPIKDITRFHPPAGGPVHKEFNSFTANYWAIFNKSKNQDAAKQVIGYFLGNIEAQDGIFANAPGFALPAYEKVWDASKYIPTNKVAMDTKPVAVSQELMVPNQYPGPASNPAIAAANTQGVLADMIASVLKGTKPADAVKTAQATYVKIFKEFGKPGQK